MLRLQTKNYSILLSDDPTQSESSGDGDPSYPYQYWLGESIYLPSAKYRLSVITQDTEIASCILKSSLGATTVHEHSALLHNGSCIAAISAFVCALAVPSLQLQWQIQADDITCFGIYHAAKHNCYISHGKCSIACLSEAGTLLWGIGGKDIFINGFQLFDDYVEVIDWNDERYRIEIPSGENYLITG